MNQVFLNLAIWILIIEALNFGFSSFYRHFFKNYTGINYGFSRTLSILLFGTVIFLLNHLKLIEANQQTCILMLGVLIVLGFIFRVLFKIKTSFLEYLKDPATSLYFITLFSFLVLRSFQPEITWGEKPMDFTFLNYFSRLTTLPPEDPWAAGHQMSYYYLGIYFFTLFIKIGNLDTGIAYNLIIATLPALLVTTLYSFFYLFTASRVYSCLASLGVTLFGNLEIFRLFLTRKNVFGFDLAWASTRLYTSPSFNEHPIWSFAFADLHAHVIAYPFVALLLFQLALFYLNSITSFGFTQMLLMGINLGALVGINTWDSLVYAPLTLILFLLYFLKFRKLEIILKGLITAIVSIIIAMPFVTQILLRPNEVGKGVVFPNEYNTTSSLLYMFGLYLAPIFFFSFLKLGNYRFKDIILKLIYSFTPLLVVFYSFYRYNVYNFKALFIQFTNSDSPVLTLLEALAAPPLLNLFFFWLIFFCCNLIDIKNFKTVLFCLAGLIFIYAEHFFLIDRMNTIFKFYTTSWIPLGMSAFLVINELLRLNFKNSFASIMIYCLISTIFLLGFTSGIASSIGLTSASRVAISPPNFTLDGRAYLEFSDKNFKKGVDWANNNIHGTPRVLEAFGMSYAGFTKFTMNTGLPTILGWEHHVFQRGVSRNEISIRKSNIQDIYTTKNRDKLIKLIKESQLQYIILGENEIKAYGNEAGRFFYENQYLLKEVFNTPDFKIFKVL